jgi:hypothetical protein
MLGGIRGSRKAMPDRPKPPPGIQPAPWDLEGRGWILALAVPDAVRGERRGRATQLGAERPAGPSLLLFVDYTASPVGPYRELAWLPGRFAQAGGPAWSITHIVVDSVASRASGRANWGIPKEMARFECRRDGRGAQVAVSAEGRALARLSVSSRGPALPFASALLPSALTRLVHYHAGHRYALAPSGRGRVGLARVRELWSDEERWPALAGARIALALAVPRFRLRFPEAVVQARQEQAA